MKPSGSLSNEAVCPSKGSDFGATEIPFDEFTISPLVDALVSRYRCEPVKLLLSSVRIWSLTWLIWTSIGTRELR